MRRGQWWQSLATRLVVGVLVALLLVAGLLGLLWHDRRERERSAALDNLKQTVEAIAIIADDVLDDGMQLARAVASDPVVHYANGVEIQRHLQRQQAAHPGAVDVLVTDAAGNLLASSSGEAVSRFAVEAARQSAALVTAHGRLAPFTTPYNAESTETVVVVGVPILLDDGLPPGTVTVILSPATFSSHVRNIRLFPRQVIGLIDRDGRLAQFLHQDEAEGRWFLSWVQRDRTVVPGVRAALGGEVVALQSFTGDLTRDERLAVFVPTPRYGWVVGGSWPVAEALAGSRAAEQRELLIFLGIGLIILIGAVLVARSVVQPLGHLAHHAAQLGSRDFAPITAITSHDEIGRVAAAMNAAAAQIQEMVRDLEAERATADAVIAQLPVGVTVVDAHTHHVTRMNAVTRRLVGDDPSGPVPYNPAGSFGAYHLDGRPYHPDERPLGRVLREGVPITGVEFILRRPGRTDQWLRTNSAPVRDGDGRMIAAVQTFEDMTDLRHQEQRASEREAFLRALIEQFPADMFVVDRSYRIMMRGGQRIVRPDLSAEDVVGVSMETTVSPQEFSEFKGHAEQAFAGETVVFSPRVQGRVLRVTITPLRNADGEIDRVLAVNIDETEEAARREQAGREEKLRALGQMAGGIAHDVNQALTLVSGYGELARDALRADPPDLAAVSDMIGIMERAAYDSGTTVKRLLTFTRGETAERTEPVDIAALLDEVARLTAPRWQHTARADGGPVTLEVDASPGLLVDGSPSALREALTNLVFNALDAMPAGGSVLLSARGEAAQVVIEVRDTGSGMSPEVKARAFEPFFTTKGSAGTGLGMAMVYGIVQRHHGEIDVTSAPGQGTSVHLRFPVAAPADATARPEPDTADIGGLHILVVDDETKLATLAARMLIADGHSAQTAATGEDALALLAAASFDLVISDISMGDGMNGWDLAAEIGRRHPDVPVVLASGWGAGISESEAQARGASAVMAKPYRRADLQAVIARALPGAGPTDAPHPDSPAA